MKKTILLTIVASLALAATAAAKTPRYYVPRAHHACKVHYRRETVKIRERKHGKLVRRHHKIVKVRQTRCVYVAPRKTTKPTTAPTLAAPSVVRAGIDPSYTQDASDNLKVTWDYSASATGSLPDGTLSLIVQEPNKTGSSGGCTMNVGGTVTGGTCTQELPHYGAWNVTVAYNGASSTVAPASQTETEDIEPLPLPPPAPPAPITLTKVWGTDAPSSRPTIAATVIGSTASIEVTDADYEGASSVLASDQNGDSCAATVSGQKATCQMSLGPNVTPSSFQVSYPGGSSTQATNAAGALVTTTWPAQTVAVANPSVTVQQATVEECGGSQQGGPIWTNPAGTCSFGNPGTWSNPVETTTGRQIQLDAVAFGSIASDRDPTHGDGQVSGFLTYTVTGGIEGTDYTASDFQNGPDNSADCSEVTTQSFDAGTGTYGPDEPTGTCFFKFQTAGTYTVSVTYTTEDANYATVRNVDSETIDVLP
jgi:hypothetical protein